MTNHEKNILEMTNEEIRDRIISLNIKQLRLIKESSYLNAINGINTLHNTIKEKNNIIMFLEKCKL